MSPTKGLFAAVGVAIVSVLALSGCAPSPREEAAQLVPQLSEKQSEADELDPFVKGLPDELDTYSVRLLATERETGFYIGLAHSAICLLAVDQSEFATATSTCSDVGMFRSVGLAVSGDFGKAVVVPKNYSGRIPDGLNPTTDDQLFIH